MRGLVTGRDVLSNLGIIWREFGARCLLRCVWAVIDRRQTTFLEVVFKR